MTDFRPFRADPITLSSQLTQAAYDHVTGLPNRQQYLRHATLRPPAGETLVMVTLADAGHYSAILRSLGHDYADDFVRIGLARIQEIVEAEIYHISILSFAFLTSQSAEALAARLINAFKHPLNCAGIPVLTRIGVGLVAYHNLNSPALLRTALAAAQDSRVQNTGWSRYDPVSDDAHRRGLLLISGLANALTATDQLSLKYQPKISLRTGQCCGVEALARWRHPGLGKISPAEFIPLIETTALIGPFTEWVLKTAGAQTSRWHQAGLAVNLAINASPQNLGDVAFTQMVAEMITAHQLPPISIEIEFTETSLASNQSFAASELAKLRALGVHVALDDFGTGFCNFSYLAAIPADILKIDRSFIRNIGSGTRACLLVRNIILLAQALQFRVVAEGIEDAPTLQMLQNWGCDEAQGFYIARPLAPDDFISWFRSARE